MTEKALVTGISGQDGSYLAEHLLSLGYEVHGIVRRVAIEEPKRRLGRIHHILDKLHLHAASLDSYSSICQVLKECDFTECYHLAAQSFVAENFEDGLSTLNTNVSGTHYMLAALRAARPSCRFYFAGSSEMFGRANEAPQRETTRFHPRSPYGISKLAGYHLTVNYRETYGMFCSSGILFNHEGPRRGFEFVTRKITSHVARIARGLETRLPLGNLEAQRDWGHAEDYVRAMHLILQHDHADDFVIATGEVHSVRELCEVAFAEVGLDYRDYVVPHPQFYRPAEAGLLVGDASKARQELGWEPRWTFKNIVREMVHCDLEALDKPAHGANG
jgi:GDPmannose 4,6-dehydratase